MPDIHDSLKPFEAALSEVLESFGVDPAFAHVLEDWTGNAASGSTPKLVKRDGEQPTFAEWDLSQRSDGKLGATLHLIEWTHYQAGKNEAWLDGHVNFTGFTPKQVSDSLRGYLMGYAIEVKQTETVAPAPAP
jgi:hypothetical protein